MATKSVYRPLEVLKLLTVLMSFGAFCRAEAQLTCAAVLKNSDSSLAGPAYGVLKKNFHFNPDYKVVVPQASEISNQCSLATCHLHSWVALLEQNSHQRKNEDIKLSTHYLSAQHWLARSLALLDSSGTDVQLKLTAYLFESRRILLTYGLVPDEAWQAGRDFESDPQAGRVSEYIENLVARARLQRDSESDPSKKKQIVEKARQDILQIFERNVGAFPTRFQFRGRNYTPQTFQQTFFPNLSEPFVNVNVNRDRRAATTLEESGDNYKILSANIDQMEAVARDVLDHGQNVFLIYEHNPYFVDSKSGVMSIAAFEIPPLGGPLPFEQRIRFNKRFGGHAVQIIGYDVDPKTQRVSKWKIRNSWGEDSGDRGYYHMFADYFRAFASGIGFSDPRGDLTPESLVRPPQPVQLPLAF